VIALLAQSSTLEEDPGALEMWVEDNAMVVGVVVMVGLLIFGIAWTWGAAHRNARQKAMAPTAKKAGLHYSPGDLFGSTKVAFPLFRAGVGRNVENVMWRDGHRGRPVRAFDYSYYTEHRDNEGKITQRWKHFSCAMGRHNGLWPTVLIGRERALDKVAQRVGLPDIELESEEFNRAFVIQCEDAKFATDLLSPEMMEFLLTTKGLLEFETKGRWLLISTKRVGAADMPGLVTLADEFIRRIPPLIWDIYPHAPDDAGDLLPEEGLGLGGLGHSVDSGGSSASSVGPGIFIPGVDTFGAGTVGTGPHEFHDERTPSQLRGEPSSAPVEYDLDGNPIDPRDDEKPWR
jgi:hypothetical protein